MYTTSGDGSISSADRRQLLCGLSAFSMMAMLPARAVAQSTYRDIPQLSSAPIKTVALNHVGLLCSDVKRSVDFYQHLFGMPIQAYSRNGTVCLRIGEGPQFFAIMKAENTQPRIGHFCLTVADFDPNRIAKILTSSGITPQIKMRTLADGGGGPTAPNGTPELFLKDVDGLAVQLQHASYTGGGGLNGNGTINAPPLPFKAPLSVHTLNHITNRVKDVEQSSAFYQRLFGMPHQIKYSLSSAPCMTFSGESRPSYTSVCQSRVNSGGQPEINHVCLGIRDFDANAERTLAAINEFGLKSGASAQGPMTAQLRYARSVKDGGPAFGGPPEGTATINLRDPDNLAIQLADVIFCGEANARKDGVCPNPK